MKEYRARVCPDDPRARPARKPMKKFDLGQLTHRCRLADMVDFPEATPSMMNTVDEEFETYTTATFEQAGDQDDDILVFWEVSIPTTHYILDLGLCSIET